MYSNLTLILILGLLIALVLFIGLIISLTGHNSRVPRLSQRPDNDPSADGIPPIPTTGGKPAVDTKAGHFYPDPLPQEDRPNVDPNPCEERGYGMD